MEDKYVIIQLVDMCYYDDDFKYEPIIVKKDEDFEKKYEGLVKVCKNYEDFNEIEEYINDNFIKMDFEKRKIEV